MPKFVPPTRPRLSAGQLIEMIGKRGIEFSKHPLIIAGVRGYYTKTMGDPTKDDIGIYDDAIFLLTENMMAAFNGNTDPSKRRPGQGFGNRKGMARLQPGAWLSYKFAQHSGPSTPPYDAICQRAGPVTVMRDGITQDYEHTGNFGINIHRGSMNSTSSEGCQTIYPTQWLEFIISAQSQAKRLFGAQWKSVTIPYVLMTHAELSAG